MIPRQAGRIRGRTVRLEEIEEISTVGQLVKQNDYKYLLWNASRRKKKQNARPASRTLNARQCKYLYARMKLERIIRKAWAALRKGKTKRDEVKRIDSNLDDYVKKMQLMIENTKPSGYEVEHPELAYEPPIKRRTKIVNEHGKRREAHLAGIWEQWYFHIIVEVLRPIVLNRIYRHSCGSIPGRGPHSGKRHLEKKIRAGKGMRNFFKGDIRHFYDSLRIDIVIREMRYLIADELFLYCIWKIYKYVKKGILIGLYISPWLANFVLMRLDFLILAVPGVEIMERYMDDITVFANAKKVLWKVKQIVAMELGRLRLRLKRTWQICKFDYVTKKTKTTKDGRLVPVRIGRPLDFMGFLFFREKTVIRKGIMLKSTRQARKLYKAKEAGRRIYLKAARAMLSRMGWFDHTNSYGCYLAEIKPYVNIKKLKRLVSKKGKEADYDRLEGRTARGAAA